LCTDLDLSLLYILTLRTHSKFARKNNFLALGVCFPQPCSSAGRRFAASRSRVQNYLVFDRDLFPRLTHMQNLITHIQKGAAYLPRTTSNIITYDPLIFNGEEQLPLQRPQSSHPEFRPTVQRGLVDDPNEQPPGEQSDEDLDYDDLVELYGYDEERGLRALVLEKLTEIEIPLKDEYGAITWVDGTVTSTTKGSLEFKVTFPGSPIDEGIWTQTRSRAEMEGTSRLPPAMRRRQPGTHTILSTQGYTP